MWYHKKKKFLDGIEKCSKLSDDQFEEVLKKIHQILKEAEEDLSILLEVEINSDNVTNEEKTLILKTIFYILQRFSMFILSPVKLQSDLNDLGFSTEKTQILINTYSEISRPLIKDLDMSASTSTEEQVLWELKTTLADPANQKCKIPKAKITLKNRSQQIVFDDLSHSELSVLFNKLESIQSELDNLNK